MARKKRLRVGIPRLTLFIVILSLIAYSFPPLSDLLVYDRQAILRGEFWRLFTAPFVHFSASHIFWDITVFAAAGLAIEAAGYRRFSLVCGFTALIPSLVFLLASPDLDRYGGLSGLATGALAYFCLSSALKTEKNRLLWLAILAVMGVKILTEAMIEAPIFAQVDSKPFLVLTSVHIFGYLAALAVIIWTPPNQSGHATVLPRKLTLFFKHPLSK